METLHDLNHRKICLLCLGKTKTLFTITDLLKVEVKKVFPFVTNDSRLSTVLCSGCRRDLYRLKNDEQKDVKVVDIF